MDEHIVKWIDSSVKEEFMELWTNPDSKRIVITHDSCEDGRGTGAAVLQHTYDYNDSLSQEDVVMKILLKPEFIFTEYNEYNIEDLKVRLKDAVVFVGDFSFMGEDYEAISKVVKSIVMVDHHSTPIKDPVSDLPNTHFDNGHSGARLAWDFFHPGKYVPGVINLIEDRDLFDFKYGNNSRALHLYLKSKTPNDLQEVIECFKDEEVVLGYVNKFIKQVEIEQAKYHKKALTAVPFTIRGKDFVGINLTSDVSETLNSAGIHFGLPAMSYFIKGDSIIFSLRNSVKGGLDVEEIAKSFGGGGHPQAAGFKIQLKDLDLNMLFNFNTIF